MNLDFKMYSEFLIIINLQEYMGPSGNTPKDQESYLKNLKFLGSCNISFFVT